MRSGRRRIRIPGSGPKASVSGVRNRKTPRSLPSISSLAATRADFGPPSGLVFGMNFWASTAGVFSTNSPAARSNSAVVRSAAASLPYPSSVHRKVPVRRIVRNSVRSRSWPLL